MNNNRPDHLPPGLERLWDLSHNLWWTWNPDARRLFQEIDPTLWRRKASNTVAFLREVAPERLNRTADDKGFRARLAGVLSRFDQATIGPCDPQFADAGITDEHPVAYFCAEFGLHSSVPVYSGGLGVLAGDHCREASDRCLPMVGLGLFYQRGYFRQRLLADGRQEAVAEPLNLSLTILERPDGAEQSDGVAQVPLNGRQVRLGVWRIRVGRVPIYLIDTDLEQNHPEDRALSYQLYSGDLRMRLRQEIVLGIGGVRVLRALGLRPSVWHMNEGHTAFMALERLREFTDTGLGFDQALADLRQTTLFTTHTPVAAGHDRFPAELVNDAMGAFFEESGLDLDQVLALAAAPEDLDRTLNMTALALRTSDTRNAVSRQHAVITRRMWQGLWPERPVEEVPIVAITNGVHVPFWMAPEVRDLLDRHLGPGWVSLHEDPAIWEGVRSIPDRDLWEVHRYRKDRLLGLILERIRRAWTDRELEATQIVAAGSLLEPNALTLGFARRFATYKRAELLFSDPDRLVRLVSDPWHPVQIIFAGKAHPRDQGGQEIVRRIYRHALDPALAGRIAFVEDYDMQVARHLVSGVDVWLNNPLPPMEASGTSGEKAAINGIPHFSTLDGWWPEAYRGDNGWAIGDSWEKAGPFEHREHDPERDAHDAATLYETLEKDIVPLYYERDSDHIPPGWVAIMKESMIVAGSRFSARRMLQDYLDHLYLPAAVRRQT